MFQELLEDYARELEELTFNSKPIINTLTMIAGENLEACSEIVGLIEARIKYVRNTSLVVLAIANMI